MQFKALKDKATIPVISTEGSAGHDLFAYEDGILYPHQRLLISTGIGWENDSVGQEYVGIIKPRSSLAHNFGIDVLAGVIDSDYEEEIKVLLINHGDTPFRYKAGHKIAQMIIVDYYIANNNIVLSDPRSGGFGSTGK